MPNNFLTDGNGILRCYNLYPRQFRNIDEMTEYLPAISEMGFNAVWINPIQESGGVIAPETMMKRDKNYGVKAGNLVTGSLYAMSDPVAFNRDFSVAPGENDEEKRYAQDKIALLKFTEQARKLNLVPMFDLVLNHVAASAAVCKNKPHWFKGIHTDFKDANAFNYVDPGILNEIIEQFWKPYIRAYFIDYGFDGVRVDAVGYLHFQLRQAIYTFIYELCEKNGKPKPVILDEALFSRKPPNVEANDLLLNHEGPTHILAGTHHGVRNPDGSLPFWVKEVIDTKERVIFKFKNGQNRVNTMGGTVNFTGNHDLNSLAGSVLAEMARTFLANDSQANTLYSHFKSNFILPERGYEDSREKVFLYPYIVKIEREMQCGNQHILSEFETRLREKIALAALTAGGGWYLLCGDEYCDRLSKPVFKRENGEEIYPAQVYKLFENADRQIEEILFRMAEEDMQKDWPELHALIIKDYQQLRTFFLASYIENIKNQINAQVSATCERFSNQMRSYSRRVNFSKDEYIIKPRNYKNHWRGKNNLVRFIKSINNILNELPQARSEFSFNIIPFTVQPELLFILRKSGDKKSLHVDLCIINLASINFIIHPPTWQYIVELCWKKLASQYDLKNPEYNNFSILVHTSDNIVLEDLKMSYKDLTPQLFFASEKSVAVCGLASIAKSSQP